ncbi:MAG: DUF2071 domain-containing protein [Thermoanaerobaculia bacterium]
MKLPAVQGVIRRRILVNFRVRPDVMQAQIPARFTPKLHAGNAIAGICLIRLEEIRPRSLPSFVGLASENAAHRVAVRWKGDSGEEKEGVFIPRRDTNSTMNRLAGGRLFPGEHHLAAFEVDCSDERIALEMESSDGEVAVRVRGTPAANLPATSCFSSLAEASAFFEPGSLGYSTTAEPGRLDGVALKTRSWKVEPLEVEEVFSSYFSDETRFPKGSVAFDCALLMRNIEHEWQGTGDLYV